MNEFRSQQEEVERLLSEIEDTKDVLKKISARLSGIEKHVRRAFQIPKPVRERKAPSGKTLSAKSREELMTRFDDVRNLYVESAPWAADRALSETPDDELRAIAKEIGLPDARKSGISQLRAGIMQKVRESSLLGTDSLRGAEKTSQPTTGDGLPVLGAVDLAADDQ